MNLNLVSWITLTFLAFGWSAPSTHSAATSDLTPVDSVHADPERTFSGCVLLWDGEPSWLYPHMICNSTACPDEYCFISSWKLFNLETALWQYYYDCVCPSVTNEECEGRLVNKGNGVWEQSCIRHAPCSTFCDLRDLYSYTYCWCY